MRFSTAHHISLPVLLGERLPSAFLPCQGVPWVYGVVPLQFCRGVSYQEALVRPAGRALPPRATPVPWPKIREVVIAIWPPFGPFFNNYQQRDNTVSLVNLNMVRTIRDPVAAKF